MVGSLSLTMAVQGMLPIPLVALVFGRDFGLVLGTLYHRYQSKDPGAPFFNTTDVGSFEITPSYISKANTVLQVSLLGLTLTHGAWDFPESSFLRGLHYAVALSTVASGFSYANAYFRKGGAFDWVTMRKERKG